MSKPLLRLFLDTEFTGLHQKTTLISLALVAESGEEFYAEFTDYDKTQINTWLEAQVLEKLVLNANNQQRSLSKMHIIGNGAEIKAALEIWLNQFVVRADKSKPQLQIWADVGHYDWVLFCELFGGAMAIPNQIHFMCMDLSTFLFTKGIDFTLPRLELVTVDSLFIDYMEHNALSDAHLIKSVFIKYDKNAS